MSPAVFPDQIATMPPSFQSWSMSIVLSTVALTAVSGIHAKDVSNLIVASGGHHYAGISKGGMGEVMGRCKIDL